MESITWKCLSDITELITKGTTPTTLGFQFQENGINFLKIECFDDEGNYIPEKIMHISEECDNKLKRSRLQAGDVLFSIAGALGRVAVVTEDMLPANTNQALAIIRVNDSNVYLPYLKLILSSPIVIKQFNRKKQGVAQLNLSLKDINELEIPLPSKNRQIEFANLFDKLQSIITLRKQQLAKLDELVKARFVEMFGNNKYPTVKTSDVCDFITKGTTPPANEIFKDYSEDRIPYLKVYNLSFTGDLLFKQEPQYISKSTHNGKLSRSKVYPNDVLMNIVGPPLGKFSVVTNEYPEWNVNQAIAIFRAKDKITPQYLMSALMQPDVLRPFLEQAVGIRQLNLSLEQCRNLEISLPPLELQEQFAAFVSQVDKSKVAVQKALDKALMLFDSLMQEYFG